MNAANGTVACLRSEVSSSPVVRLRSLPIAVIVLVLINLLGLLVSSQPAAG